MKAHSVSHAVNRKQCLEVLGLLGVPIYRNRANMTKNTAAKIIGIT